MTQSLTQPDRERQVHDLFPDRAHASGEADGPIPGTYACAGSGRNAVRRATGNRCGGGRGRGRRACGRGYGALSCGGRVSVGGSTASRRGSGRRAADRRA